MNKKKETMLISWEKTHIWVLLKATLELGMMVHTCSLSTWETEAGGSWDWSHYGLHMEFNSSLATLIRLSLKTLPIHKKNANFAFIK
jgi:hypothetical protein